MNLEEKVREWSDVSDNDVAGQIFKANGITPANELVAKIARPVSNEAAP